MAHVIVLGNEKGGSGKSTTAMHVIAALMRSGHKVGALDLDLRQKSLFRYLENRADFIRRKQVDLPMPRRIELHLSNKDSQQEAQVEEEAWFGQALKSLDENCSLIVIDCPGAHSWYSQMAHAVADTLMTPLNDSLVDFDMLARVDSGSGNSGTDGLFRDGVESPPDAHETGIETTGLGRVAQPNVNSGRPQQTLCRFGPEGFGQTYRLSYCAGVLRAGDFPRIVSVRVNAAGPARFRRAAANHVQRCGPQRSARHDPRVASAQCRDQILGSRRNRFARRGTSYQPGTGVLCIFLA